jgi:membrane protease YdiL (CAAX protease family)
MKNASDSYGEHFLKGNTSKANAILFGCALHVVLQIVDGFFKEPLYQYSEHAFWIFDFVKFVAIPAVVLVWLYRAFSIAPASYGLRSRRKTENWFYFLGLTLFLAVVLNLVYQGAQHFAWNIVWRVLHPDPAPAFYKSLIPGGLLHYPAAFYFAATAGFTEEVFFRGLPLLYMKERFGNTKPVWIYAVVTSVLFASAHWENGLHEVIATFVYGIASSVLYLKLRDLRPLVGAHALIDFWEFS